MEGEPYEESSEDEADSPAKQSQPKRTLIQSTEPSQGENATQPSRNKPKKRCWRDNRWRHPQVIVNGVLALAAIAGLLFYYCQLRQQIESTHAAAYAIKLARDSSHLDQRAWVAGSHISGKPELDKPFVITVTIKNTGKTFDKHLVGLVATKGKQLSDPDPDFEGLLVGGKGVISVGLVPPNGELIQQASINGGKKMTQADLDALSNPVLVILLFGKLTYFDIFGCEHWTTYCWRVRADGFFDTYTDYNDADENCLPEATRP